MNNTKNYIEEDYYKNVQFKNVKAFITILQKHDQIHIDLFKNFFNHNNKFFEETAQLLISTSVIKIEQEKIFLQEKEIFKKNIKILLLKNILKSDSGYSNLAKEYFDNFYLENNSYIFKESVRFKRRFFSIKNFFNGMGITKYLSEEKNQLNNIYEDIIFKKRKISLNTLLSKQKRDREIGDKAEDIIFAYEKNRLKNLINKTLEVNKISTIDVSAGYDIKSWTILNDKSMLPRYIEVKTYSITSVKKNFYWSKNEIDKSKRYADQYYLYLLPHDKDFFDISRLEIIQNPYKNIYQSTTRWEKTYDKLYFENKE